MNLIKSFYILNLNCSLFLPELVSLHIWFFWQIPPTTKKSWRNSNSITNKCMEQNGNWDSGGLISSTPSLYCILKVFGIIHFSNFTLTDMAFWLFFSTCCIIILALKKCSDTFSKVKGKEDEIGGFLEILLSAKCDPNNIQTNHFPSRNNVKIEVIFQEARTSLSC